MPSKSALPETLGLPLITKEVAAQAKGLLTKTKVSLLFVCQATEPPSTSREINPKAITKEAFRMKALFGH